MYGLYMAQGEWKLEMHNTIKTLLLTGSLLQGMAAFAGEFTVTVNSNGAHSYTVVRADDPQLEANCPYQVLDPKPTQITCGFKLTLTQDPINLMKITNKGETCMLTGTGTETTLTLGMSGSCSWITSFDPPNTVNLP